MFFDYTTLYFIKAELKCDGKDEGYFLRFYALPKLSCLFVSEVTQTDIGHILTPIWHVKVLTAEKVLNRLNVCFKYAAALGWDIDLQVIAKTKSY